jgi:membrane-associated phospholipid phosphatase
VEWMQSWQNGFFDVFFNFISFLGEEYVYIVLLSILYFAVDKKLGEYVGFSLFLTGILNTVIKGFVRAERPYQKYPDRVTNLRPESSGGYSFPSGHTQMFTTFSFGVAFYIKRYGLFLAASILSILMAMSRMYLGVHFLEDVLTSIVLGIAVAYGGYLLFQKIGSNDALLQRIYLGILVVFLPFVVFMNNNDLFKTYGLMVGFTVGMYLEKRFVQFTMDLVWWKKAIRVVGGLTLMILTMVGLDVVFGLFAEEGTTLLNYLDGIRYGMISLVGLGLYPFLFRRFQL